MTSLTEIRRLVEEYFDVTAQSGIGHCAIDYAWDLLGVMYAKGKGPRREIAMNEIYDKLRKRLREAQDWENMWFQRAYDLERELYRANKRIEELESKLIEEQQK